MTAESDKRDIWIAQLPPWIRQAREPDPGEADRHRSAQIAAYVRAELPIVNELKAAGIDVEHVQDLCCPGRGNEQAVSILTKWLNQCDHISMKHTIARALGMPWAKGSAAPALICEFSRLPPEIQPAKWTIGNALASTADDTVVDELIELALDRSHGTSRQMLMLALAKTKDERVIDPLVRLLNDGQVAGHAVIALGKLKAKTTLDAIRPFLNHGETWIRKEAEKAIRSME
jgi:HEAT repeat protein